MVKLNCLGEDGLQDFIGGFDLSIHLRVVWSRFMVLDTILFGNSLHQFGCKLCPLINENISRYPKPSEDVLKEEIYKILLSGRV